MTMIISVTSTELDGPSKDARRLESIIAQEKVEAYVVTGACLPEILQVWGITRLPVFRINEVTVWEGQEPPADVERSWLHRPKSIDEAVDQVLKSFGKITDDPFAHLWVGNTIRNFFGVWGRKQGVPGIMWI
jgi:hypothetical protein